MIIPIALKYAPNGVLQFVRCLYFDINPNTQVQTYAISDTRAKTRQYYHNSALLEDDITKTSAEIAPDGIACYPDVRDATPDSLYSYVLNLPSYAIDMSKSRIVNIPAKEYLLKYGNKIKTKDIVLLDCDDNIISDELGKTPTMQVIAPKIAYLYINNKSKEGTVDIRQEARLIPDNCHHDNVWRYDKYTYKANIFIQGIRLGRTQISNKCTVYAIDYQGNITRLLLEELAKTRTPLGNIALHSAFYSGISGTYYAEGSYVYEINEYLITANKNDKTEDLNTQIALLGLPQSSCGRYENLISPTAINALIPSAKYIHLALPNDYNTQNIRFGDMIEHFQFVAEKDLDAVILPQYAGFCKVKMRSARVLKLPECVYAAELLSGLFSLDIKQYPEQESRLQVQRDVNIQISSALNLGFIELLLPNQSRLTKAASDIIISIKDAPNLKTVKLSQDDICYPAVYSSAQVHITGADYELIANCIISELDVLCSKNQILNIYIYSDIQDLIINYMRDAPGRVNIFYARPEAIVKNLTLCELRKNSCPSDVLNIGLDVFVNNSRWTDAIAYRYRYPLGLV